MILSGNYKEIHVMKNAKTVPLYLDYTVVIFFKINLNLDY